MKRSMQDLEHLTLDDLLARVREEDGCLVWALCARDGVPSWTINGRQWPARRVVWALVHGRLPKRTMRVAATCGNDLCVHPDHAAERSRAFELKGLKRDLAFKARIAATKRRQAGTPPAAVAFVRASSSSHAQAARETGLTQQMVSKIRSHDRWRNYRDPFEAWGG